ncbi:MAG: NAD(P)-dependent oxidoreductase [Actinomycetota bacterium]|nr:NAD(P)-dependent oxidoreductase [Actinomycetota bacterium]
MRVLVTGSAGHLGEALVRTLRERQHEVAGLDLLDSPFTSHVGSITDTHFVRGCMQGVDFVMHTAALHKPHVVTHSRRAFVETNICGTLNILETALASGVSGIVFTSSTSAFGAALSPTRGQPATWVTEGLQPIPKNIYGVTKSAAEELCELFYRSKGMPTIVLRTSRFFPEADDNPEFRQRYDDLNLKVNEYLYRRVDLADAAEAHILAAERVAAIGFGQYIVSATTPFQKDHLSRLRTDVAGVVRSLFPDYEEEYSRRSWRMLPGIDRVYVNHCAQEELGWRPRFDFRHVLDRLQRGEHVFSPLAKIVGSKGYHPRTFEDGPYPIESSG